MNFDKNKGFSLTELMVVIAIIGILAAIALPMYQRYVENSRLTQAKAVALQLQQELQQIKLRNGAIAATDVTTLNAANGKVAALTRENGLTPFFTFTVVLTDNKAFVNASPIGTSKKGLYADSAGNAFKCATAALVAAHSTSCEKM